jgi:transcriptional regulator with PAS, ATPase and Fis domain
MIRAKISFDFDEAFEERPASAITIKSDYQATRKNLSLRQQIKTEGLFPQIIGRSAGMKRVFEFIKKASEVESNVLIQGESGTGKELVARAIHSNSGRKKYGFLTVNCGALPESLKSTLFGYERGLSLGNEDHQGYFEEATGLPPGKQKVTFRRSACSGPCRKESGPVGKNLSMDVRMIMAQ